MKFLFVVFLLQYCAKKSFVITFVEKNITVIIRYIQTFITYILEFLMEKKDSKRYNIYYTLYTCQK